MLKQLLSLISSFRNGEKKEMQDDYRIEDDYLAADPRSWYQGPLIFFEETQERLEDRETNQTV